MTILTVENEEMHLDMCKSRAFTVKSPGIERGVKILCNYLLSLYVALQKDSLVRTIDLWFGLKAKGTQRICTRTLVENPLLLLCHFLDEVRTRTLQIPIMKASKLLNTQTAMLAS